jgi:hypothetical protein
VPFGYAHLAPDSLKEATGNLKKGIATAAEAKKTKNDETNVVSMERHNQSQEGCQGEGNRSAGGEGHRIQGGVAYLNSSQSILWGEVLPGYAIKPNILLT